MNVTQATYTRTLDGDVDSTSITTDNGETLVVYRTNGEESGREICDANCTWINNLVRQMLADGYVEQS